MGEDRGGGQYRSIQFYPKMTYLEDMSVDQTGPEFRENRNLAIFAISLTTCSF